MTPRKSTPPKAEVRRSPLRSEWLPSIATLASAVLYVGAFPPWDLQLLAWIALVPWIFHVLGLARSIDDARTRRRRVLIQSTWLGILISLGGFHWVAYVLEEFAGLPASVAAFGLLLFSFICQPQFYLAGPLLAALERPEKNSIFSGRRSVFFRALAFALLYAAIDAILPKLFVDTLGHSFYSSRIFRQLATLGGAPLLTFLAAGANLALARLARGWVDQRRDGLRGEQAWAAVILAAIAAGGIWGTAEAKRWEDWLLQPESELPRVKIGVIQGNIGDFQKIASERGVRGAAEEVMSTFFRLSDEAIAREPEIDALVWPETAYPSTFRAPDTSRERRRDLEISEFVRSRGVPLLFGGYDREFRTEFNAFFFHLPRPWEEWSGIGRGDGDLDVYRKTILLMFGETIPGMDYLPFVKEAFPQVGNFGHGDGPSVHAIPLEKMASLGRLPFLPMICYEALYSRFGIGGVNKGAKAILNITNDSWFGTWGEPQLHLALSTFRSIETRLSQVRTTNTGISALILPDGSIAERSRQNEPQVLIFHTPVARDGAELPSRPLIVETGPIFEWIALAIGLALAFALGIRPRLRTPRRPSGDYCS